MPLQAQLVIAWGSSLILYHIIRHALLVWVGPSRNGSEPMAAWGEGSKNLINIHLFLPLHSKQRTKLCQFLRGLSSNMQAANSPGPPLPSLQSEGYSRSAHYYGGTKIKTVRLLSPSDQPVWTWGVCYCFGVISLRCTGPTALHVM